MKSRWSWHLRQLGEVLAILREDIWISEKFQSHSKGTWFQNFTFVFMSCLLSILWRKNLYDVFSDFTKLQYFEFCVSHVIPANVQIFEFFISFMEKEPPTNIYGVLDHFSRTSEVAKFWIVKLHLNVSDVIHANEYTEHANDGLHVDFWKLLLMSFCFMMK